MFSGHLENYTSLTDVTHCSRSLRQMATAEAIRYAISRREIFERFLIAGLVELDSNIVERAIRPPTITRKNSLFAGSDGGGRTWATIANR